MSAFESGSDVDRMFASFHHAGLPRPALTKNDLQIFDSYVSTCTSNGDVDSLLNSAGVEPPETEASSVVSHISSAVESDSKLPLHFGHNQDSFTIPIPSDLFLLATYLRDRFLASHPGANSEGVQDLNLHKSTPSFITSWLEYIASNVTSSDGPYGRLLRVVLEYFENELLRANDIHVFVSTIESFQESKQQILRAYFEAKVCIRHFSKSEPSALLRAATDGSAKLYGIFGGQGNTEDYLEELSYLYNTYHCFTKVLIKLVAQHLSSLAESPEADGFLPKGLDILRWLQDNSAAPKKQYLVSAAVSFPLIGLLQLTQYTVTCGVLGLTPGAFRGHLKGVTGHSQGIVTAVAISASDSWEALYDNTRTAISMLFWTGLRCQQSSPHFSLDPSFVIDSLSHDEGNPSPMLSIRNLTISQVQEHLEAVNTHLSTDQQVEISLQNGPRHFVVAGPPKSLYGLNSRLRSRKAPIDLDQTRVPFSQRKPVFSSKFLPVTAPFHSKHVSTAVEKIDNDLNHLRISPKGLALPVYSTSDGEDIRLSSADNVIPFLVRMIATEKVNWELATSFPGASHIIDFGPGGPAGVGGLTANNKDGSGVRVVFAGNLSGTMSGVGYQADLFNRDTESLVYNENWLQKYRPTLVKTSAGQTYLSTKLSRLLSLPPIMVAGMTPTTVHWDFVTATMSAGYHIELAGGGYRTEESMREAIGRVAAMAPQGRGITINGLYVNPKALSWQITLIRKLQADGINIDGLTIGAGVPSLSVASEYIDTLRLRHISFKPGSVRGINDVIQIAKAHPNTSVMLQWTGGRGGGHHSCEDFHQPILSTYARLRRCDNLVLVAGSGFGDWKDTYPYLNGDWSTRFGYPAMPFDGILFGSRVMVAKEAHTSLAAKEAIVNTPGIAAQDWEHTYRTPSGGGGVLTVVSEMGQPIHKLATRGVKLWAELDRTIFSLPQEHRVAELQKRQAYIIQRLNADFQKVWFGVKNGQPVDVNCMTYGEVARRLIDLLYIRSQSRWIDPSYRELVDDFLWCISDRFGSSDHQPFDQEALADHPDLVVNTLLRQFSESGERLMSLRDTQFFLGLCRRPGTKPVPFIPVLDHYFETYFKKDSLWQSENLDAVVDQDAGRTCILHGPVAAQFSTKVNEPIAELLDGINNGLITEITKDIYEGDASLIPEVAYLHRDEPPVKVASESISVVRHTAGTTFHLPSDTPGVLPELSEWLSLLGGPTGSWRHALFMSDVFVRGYNRCETNPFRRILSPTIGLSVHIEGPMELSVATVSARNCHRKEFLLARLGESSKQEIHVDLLHSHTASGNTVPLRLRYAYHQEAGYAPIRELTEDRNLRVKTFYKRTWLGDAPLDFDIGMDLDSLMATTFKGDRMIVPAESIQSFYRTTYKDDKPLADEATGMLTVPLDQTLVIGWKALVKPLFVDLIDGDMLKLVHLSNSFRVVGSQIRERDEVDSIARVTAIVNQTSGTMVEVTCTVTKDGIAAVEIVTRFLFRGSFTEFDNTFQRISEPRIDVDIANTKDLAVLRSRKWFQLAGSNDFDLVGKSLTFYLETLSKPKGDGGFASIQTTGLVRLRELGVESLPVGFVNHKAEEVIGNPVAAYLERHGKKVEDSINLEQPILLNSQGTRLVMPESNEGYARVSGDFNPIHTVEAFALYAGLPGPITHGMYTSALCRQIIDKWSGAPGRMHSYRTSFVGMVLPRDELVVRVWHVGMLAGRKVLKLEAVKKDSEEIVLVGEAQVEQPPSAYIFTGQGSQEVGMGMSLYATSPVARSVWDRADKYFLGRFGFAITDIVRNNPKELTIFFGGRRGRAIKQNYMALEFQTTAEDGTAKTQRVFKDIERDTPSYTFRCPSGLLYATQFSQPALTLMSKAQYEDMKVKGLIQEGTSFAGHSLGEYSALSTLAQLMSVEELMSIVFFRGLTMRLLVEYNDQGRSEYSMCAVNPTKVGKTFTEQTLRSVVTAISRKSGWLLEIVNYNIENLQYVCTGTLRALHCLSRVLEHLRSGNIIPVAGDDIVMTKIVSPFVDESTVLDSHIELQRTATSIPLRGIDVPFHSSFLRPGVDAYRQFLKTNLGISSIHPDLLVERWIPNVTGKPFGISRRDVEDLFSLTGSAVLGQILAAWNEEDDITEKKE